MVDILHYIDLQTHSLVLICDPKETKVVHISITTLFKIFTIKCIWKNMSTCEHSRQFKWFTPMIREIDNFKHWSELLLPRPIRLKSIFLTKCMWQIMSTWEHFRQFYPNDQTAGVIGPDAKTAPKKSHWSFFTLITAFVAPPLETEVDWSWCQVKDMRDNRPNRLMTNWTYSEYQMTESTMVQSIGQAASVLRSLIILIWGISEPGS